ncbi:MULTISPECIES: acyl-CoA carboxylase epsilon subunit [Allobranchiibius]|uniref:Acyl-CoA carboxylase subunit epsilon n=1 Tax=Allobranchiibius huperziae TaxID=1874116 RepID=A0A853DGC8_9MICO|nr:MULTISPECIES: acyl-CoA carboxylase epsilon subunit [Allobranchiibius]MBO1765732.1 acyl-CoA carboxylase subunit epsilon [Allobranchiibius sp. GilTou38]NYJ73921.1 hypothetical protein [Allobranchiibius huperziae]UIJ34664.1 hypothetical protein LVQ62_16435 [Allobranchiibius sp. GilTou73]
MSDDQTAKAPTLQVISGDATAEEIAAVIAVLAAAGAAAPPAAPARSRWTGRGGGGWKGSALPRA